MPHIHARLCLCVCVCVCLCVCVWSRGETRSDPGQREHFSGLMFHDNGPRFRQGESEALPPNAWNTHTLKRTHTNLPPQSSFVSNAPLFSPLVNSAFLLLFSLPILPFILFPFLPHRIFFILLSAYLKFNYVVVNPSCSLNGLYSSHIKKQREKTTAPNL